MFKAPNLKLTAELNNRLAGSAARVRQFADNLLEQTDRLVEASIQEDWSEVARLSEFIARGGEIYGYPEVAERAWQIFHDLQEPDNAAGIKRGIVRLLGACGRPTFQDAIAGTGSGSLAE